MRITRCTLDALSRVEWGDKRSQRVSLIEFEVTLDDAVRFGTCRSPSQDPVRCPLLSAVSTENCMEHVRVNGMNEPRAPPCETWKWRRLNALSRQNEHLMTRMLLRSLGRVHKRLSSTSGRRVHLVHLSLQGHSPVLDPLLLRHLVVEHALQLLEPPRARLEPHLCGVKGLWFLKRDRERRGRGDGGGIEPSHQNWSGG